ncbi:MAG: histone deacetylase [Chloroflexi bacterium]|nr:histone deacetylase [Chloroflexota bacterium]
MTPPAFVHDDAYHAEIGPHVFPISKYRLVRDGLDAAGVVRDDAVLRPEPISDEDVLLVHSPAYLDDLRHLRWTHRTRASEIVLTDELIAAYRLASGGTLLACREALARGRAMNLGGGFHHAFPDRAEGFCYVNDVAVAVRRLQRDGLIRRALIVDCDLHQGNGTALIFRGDPRVYTFSIHQDNLYPVKQPSDLDIGLPDFTGDEEYLGHLERHVPRMLDELHPDLAVYLAGADPFMRDQLGMLALTFEGLRRRDELVIGGCVGRGVPVAVVLAGGYAEDVHDTVRIHVATGHVLAQA